MKKALLVVDIQNDFCSGGSLAIPDAEAVIEPINRLMSSKEYSLIIATQDWHPANHFSFKVNSLQGVWPVHCVQHTFGAAFHPKFDLPKVNKIVRKGENPNIDSYSGFYDNDKITKTELDHILHANNVEAVDIVGLALDYCVKYTAEDAISMGFNTTILIDYTRAITPISKSQLIDILDHRITVK